MRTLSSGEESISFFRAFWKATPPGAFPLLGRMILSMLGLFALAYAIAHSPFVR